MATIAVTGEVAMRILIAVGRGLLLWVDNGRSPTRQGLTSASQSPLLERRR